ncbi:MAG: O-antigen ligase family protein [Bacteroidota bacterium]
MYTLIYRKQLGWFYAIVAIYLVVNAICIANEFYWIFALPLVLFVLLTFIFAYDKVFFFITLMTPLSFTLKDSQLGLGLSLPTEPLMAGLLLLFVIKILYENRYDISITRHPVSIAIILGLVWMLISSLTSCLPIVSIKFLISRLWFVVPFYFIAVQIFEKERNLRTYFWLYIIGLVIVVIYTTYQHSQFAFDEKIGHWIMSPFYNDHTAYGAAIAIMLPVTIGFVFLKSYSNTRRFWAFLASAVLLVAFYLSYCRAAWLSLTIGLIVLIIIKMKIKIQWILLSLVVFTSIFFLMRTQIIMQMERNKQDSSKDLVKHLQSISNISSDASNLERLNRWNSALKMFYQKPITGWGPGTYQFVYGPFQSSKDKTIISTDFGIKGNAHSEYIGPLSEQGLPGLLFVLGVLGTVIYTVLTILKRKLNPQTRQIVFILMVGLISYYVHGFMNNFLDSDKLSVPFWGFIAALVAIDLKLRKEEKQNRFIQP